MTEEIMLKDISSPESLMKARITECRNDSAFVEFLKHVEKKLKEKFSGTFLHVEIGEAVPTQHLQVVMWIYRRQNFKVKYQEIVQTQTNEQNEEVQNIIPVLTFMDPSLP